jgi:hypothetical protein
MTECLYNQPAKDRKPLPRSQSSGLQSVPGQPGHAGLFQFVTIQTINDAQLAQLELLQELLTEPQVMRQAGRLAEQLLTYFDT